MCTGASWRDIPERYGKWNTIYKCFAHWSNLGIFEKLSSENDFSELWQHLCKSSQGGNRCKKRAFNAIGRAGKMAVDEKGKPRKIILTAGNINVAYALLEDFNLQDKTVIADRGKFY